MDDPGARITAYKQQLAQIEEYLQSDSSNEQYIKLRDDIVQVIQLTENLVEVQGAQLEGTQSTTDVRAIAIAVGDRVEVTSGDRPFAGVIKSLNDSDAQCVLKYYEFGTEVTLPLSCLRKISGNGVYESNQVAPGLKCQCKFAGDLKWYDATVDEVTADGYRVTYTQYGNKEEVPLEYLRPPPLSVLQKRAAVEVSSAVVIPENLKIKPTDTEEQKLKKKKKIKAIKGKARLQSQEAEQSAVQNTWKAFVTKAEKKSSSAKVVAPIKKHSMFASPEAVDGRVGFTGSGQGMTDYGQRKKHKFAPT